MSLRNYSCGLKSSVPIHRDFVAVLQKDEVVKVPSTQWGLQKIGAVTGAGECKERVRLTDSWWPSTLFRVLQMLELPPHLVSSAALVKTLLT